MIIIKKIYTVYRKKNEKQYIFTIYRKNVDRIMKKEYNKYRNWQGGYLYDKKRKIFKKY